MPAHLPFDAVVFDIGGTLVHEAPSGTRVSDLTVSWIDGAPRTLVALADAGLRLGAVTDTSVMTEADVRELLAADGVSDRLEALVTSVDVGAEKPDPAGLFEVLTRLDVTDSSRVLFVGDRTRDRDAAAAAGCAYAAVDPDRPLPMVLRDAFVAAGASPVRAAAALVGPVDLGAASAADARQLDLTKPPGSLARLEVLGSQLAAIAGSVPPPVPEIAVLGVFAGDHGILDSGVSPWPREVTAQMVANVAAGGAAVSVLARQTGVRVEVIDVGVATPIPHGPGIVDANIAAGTADLSKGPALTRTQALAALDVGADRAAAAVDAGAQMLITGDMGIGNTTPSAALIALLSGRPAAEVTGRGTGIDDPTLARKIALIDEAVTRARAAGRVDGLAALEEVGGLEHAALAGFIIGGAAARVPIVIDGVIALAALLTAQSLVPGIAPYVIAGHRSAEPGASAVLEHLGMMPLLDLDLRLGEGTGAVLAVPIVRSAAAILSEMATFEGAGVAGVDG